MNIRLFLSFTVIAASMLILAGCGGKSDFEMASAQITAEGIAGHIEILASDAFEGRNPGTPGEEKTIAYLTDQFMHLGLEPGNGDSFVQDVPLVTINIAHTEPLTFSVGGETLSPKLSTEYMADKATMDASITLSDAPVVFVGYGVVAPEYGWDDYEGIDVRGKIVLALVNDPGYATQDASIFTGNAMTYYGRYPYKYEEAQRQGAAGVLVVHETGPAGYPFSVVGSGATRPKSAIVTTGEAPTRPPFSGWIASEVIRELLSKSGESFDDLKARALSPEFAAVELNATASIKLTQTFAYDDSHNFIAKLSGTTRPDEVVIYMAHWDHLGLDPTVDGDQIYNGALDNASGTSGLLELAKAFVSLDPRPERSIIFLAVTAEEKGLLGSEYYGTHPVYPLNKTVAAINNDVLNSYGRTNDMVVIGHGNSELDDYVAAAAKYQGRVIVPDQNASKGYFYRSDHFSFAKHGVPSMYVDPGSDYIDITKEEGEAFDADWNANRYHKPADEFDPNWDLRGAVDDVRINFHIGYTLANESTFPNWREGNEFKATRDAMMMGEDH